MSKAIFYFKVKKKSKFGIKLSGTKTRKKGLKILNTSKKVASEGYVGKSEMIWGPFSPGLRPKF